MRLPLWMIALMVGLLSIDKDVHGLPSNSEITDLQDMPDEIEQLDTGEPIQLDFKVKDSNEYDLIDDEIAPENKIDVPSEQQDGRRGCRRRSRHWRRRRNGRRSHYWRRRGYQRRRSSRRRTPRPVQPTTNKASPKPVKPSANQPTTKPVKPSANQPPPGNTTPENNLLGECLSTHNKLRALHQDTPPLVWDSDLAKQAQSWADVNAAEFRMYHAEAKDRPNQGENIASAARWPDTGKPMTCKQAIMLWYSEIKNYDFKTGKKKKGLDSTKSTGHFTQVVWKNSKKLGMGIKVVKKDNWVKTYIVARYSPPGNYGGQYKNNVKELKTTRRDENEYDDYDIQDDMMQENTEE